MAAKDEANASRTNLINSSSVIFLIGLFESSGKRVACLKCTIFAVIISPFLNGIKNRIIEKGFDSNGILGLSFGKKEKAPDQ